LRRAQQGEILGRMRGENRLVFLRRIRELAARAESTCMAQLEVEISRLEGERASVEVDGLGAALLPQYDCRELAEHGRVVLADAIRGAIGLLGLRPVAVVVELVAFLQEPIALGVSRRRRRRRLLRSSYDTRHGSDEERRNRHSAG